MRIGLFGGSFDPVHLGHIGLACAAMRERKYEQLFWIPAACSPFKQAHSIGASGVHRAEMVRIAIRPFPGMTLSDFELTQKGKSYSVETMRHFRRQFPAAEIEWLLGADALASLGTWHEANVLAREMVFVAAPRDGLKMAVPEGFQVKWLQAEEIPVSSTLIKKELALKSEMKNIPGEVARYIREHKLYGKVSA